MTTEEGKLMSDEQGKEFDSAKHVNFDVAEKARDRAYWQGRKDATAEIQEGKDAVWMTALEKIDTIQARAQLEALRRIAEELHAMNEYLRSDTVNAVVNALIINSAGS